jgi:CPA2 family monovalent cation:H+ antiporter-2
LGVAIFKRLRLPTIAGFLVMGALVGPGGLSLVADPERVQTLAELGVVFLLFEVGLELPLERLRRLWRRALLAGGLQVGITVFGIAAVGIALGMDSSAALVLGGLVAISSTALVLRSLSDRGEIDAPHGQLAVGILLFQDLCIVPFLLLVPLLAAESADAMRAALLAVAQSGVAIAALYFAARWLLPRVLDRAAQLRSRDLFSLLAFLVVIGSAVVAEEIGLTLAVGAFLGGLVLSASPYAHQLFAEILPLRGLLLGLFFTAVGMLFEPMEALRQWDGVLIYIAGVVVLKSAVVALIVMLVLRQGIRLGILSGLSLAQTGEFSFVLAAAAAAAGLLAADLQQVFIAGSIATLLATPFLLAVAPRLADLVTRGADRIATAEGGGEVSALRDHVVLVGFGLAGQQLARVLKAQEIPYVAIEANARAVQQALQRGESVIYGDALRPAILLRVGVNRARLVVVAISDSVGTRRVVQLANRLGPQAQIIARTHYVLEVDALDAAGANGVVAEEFESAIELVSQTLRVFGVPEGGIARFCEGLRDEGYIALRATPGLILDPWLSELLKQVSTEWVDVPQTLVGKPTLEELAVRRRTGTSVLAVERGDVTEPNPDADFALKGGDRLLVSGKAEEVARLYALLEETAERAGDVEEDG